MPFMLVTDNSFHNVLFVVKIYVNCVVCKKWTDLDKDNFFLWRPWAKLKRLEKEPRLLPNVMEAIASLKEKQDST